jgi:hypothetical protein
VLLIQDRDRLREIQLRMDTSGLTPEELAVLRGLNEFDFKLIYERTDPAALRLAIARSS